MKFGRKNKSIRENKPIVQTVPSEKKGGGLLFSPFREQTTAERRLYASLRESVPLVDAAISKMVRLIGDFKIIPDDRRACKITDYFVENVRTGGSMSGLQSFIYTFADELLTYGEAVGEMVLSSDGNEVAALYNAGLDDVEIKAEKSPLDLVVYVKKNGTPEPAPNQELIVTALLNPKPGTVQGTSILKGLPFVSSVLLRIFESVKTNWERVGDIRFAVTCTPPENGSFTQESARLIADEWRNAMRSGSVCDFIAAGDVSIKVIGAESSMPNCEVPVKQMLEQIVAKLGIPPFLLGLSWSSTERMSEQQADILTSEIEYYRKVLNPVIRRIVTLQLRLCGFNCGFEIEWSNINLQDTVGLAQARLHNAQAAAIEKENNLEAENE